MSLVVPRAQPPLADKHRHATPLPMSRCASPALSVCSTAASTSSWRSRSGSGSPFPHTPRTPGMQHRELRAGSFSEGFAQVPQSVHACPLRRFPASPQLRPRQEPVQRVQAVVSSVGPGDVLLVQGSGQLTRIGANGGFMGHVMVVLAAPELVPRNSKKGRALSEIWPVGAEEVVRVASVESTRQRSGLHRSHMILHCRGDGGLVLLAEESEHDVTPIEGGALLEIWRCPSELRRSFRPDIMAAVLLDMADCQADWSYTTAARAVFSSAGIAHRESSEELRNEVEMSWETAPICTSVVISFWQRYLQGLAFATGASDLELILRWMPLKADRGLPGELLKAMQQSGWRRLAAQ